VDIDHESTFSCIVSLDRSVVHLHHSIRNRETQTRSTTVAAAMKRQKDLIEHLERYARSVIAYAQQP
jgi:hypothetical protein